MFHQILLWICVFVGVIHAEPWEAAALDAAWQKTHETLLAQTKENSEKVKAVFLGDNITHRWITTGNETWIKQFESRGAFNYGVDGDLTENVLWRLANGELDGLKPKVVVLQVGTNNLPKDNATSVTKGIETILEQLKTKLPTAKFILPCIMPRNNPTLDTIVHDINKLIAKFADTDKVFYVEMTRSFEVGLGHEMTLLFEHDHIHLSARGYETFHNLMEPTFAKLIA